MATKSVFEDVQPWPTAPVRAGPAPKDDNKPPIEDIIPLEFREELLAEAPDFLKKLDDVLGKGDPNSEDYKPGAVHRAVCADDDTLAKCGSLVNLLRKCEQHVDATHKTVKEPYLKGGKLVDAQKNALVARILAGRQIVEGLQQDYARKRQKEAAEQRAREEEERRKLEELARENNLEAALPPPPPAAPARAAPIRSDDGAAVSIGTEWCCTIEDYVKAFRKVKDDAKVREAVDTAIKRIVKATKGQQAIPGVRIFEDVKVSSR